MLTEGELKAEPLARVTPKGFDEEAPVAAEITASGGINIKKTTKEVSVPSDDEELRDRLRIWGASWVFAASRFPSKPVLGGVDMNVITDNADFLHGPRVRRSEAKDAEGRVVSRPSWNLVLSFERETRKLQAHLMNQERRPFSAALRAAWEISSIRERYFLTPMMVSGWATAIAAASSAGLSNRR